MIPKIQRTPRTKNRTKLTIGENTNTTADIIRDALIAALSALVMAYVFGSTSAKINIRKVIINVDNKTLLLPTILVNSAVISDVAKIFTKLFPNKTAPINRSRSFVTCNARAAPTDPLSALACNLLLEAAVRAVSDPEKKPDNINKIKIERVVSQKLNSKLKFSITHLSVIV